MKMRKILVSAIALLLAALMALGLVFSALSFTASAARSDSLKEKLNELKERAEANDELMAQVEDKLNANYDQIQDLVQKKQEIDEKINDTRQQMNELSEKIQDYNLSIAAKQSELDLKEDERSELNAKYKQRIRAMEENGKVSYWSVLFNARSFSDLLSRIDMINEIVVSDQLMLDQMQELVNAIEADRVVLEGEKKELENAKRELVDLEDQLEAERLESDNYIIQINSDISILNALFLEYDLIAEELQGEIDEVQHEYDVEKAKELAEARRKLLAQQAAQQAATSNKVPTGGGSAGTVSVSGFLFPLPAGAGTVITDAFGYRYHPIDGQYKMHYGVDFAVGKGTSILASKAGTVTTAGYGKINGNYIKITHSDGTQTYYLHMDTFSVNQGDYVSQGQKIGTVGSTGSSTGPHLHFQIMIGGEAVNPMDYVSVQ